MYRVSTFVVYDDIEFTKKGWINRNRYLHDGRDDIFSIPVKKDSDYLYVVERQLAGTFATEKQKLVRKLESAYRKAPFFDEGMAILKSCLECDDCNLFTFIYHSIQKIKTALKIDTELVISSKLKIDRETKGQDRVIAICKALAATDYINPIGGTALYNKQSFSDEGINLHFQCVTPLKYRQFNHNFIPNLSIIDVLMFLGVDGTRPLLGEMTLV